MNERFADLQGRVRRSRLALEDLAERTAHLRERVADEARSVHLVDLPKPPPAHVPPSDAEAAEADDFFSDAWEIALINDEGEST